ncbi:hypothetical protein [Candidatus Poriferisodalis sp.]|uniref:hypothetical protein n=1 Tax=Candidatus Poriferisodalis sp. TaxID=3101277 RepID=UPI003B01A1C2
MSLGAVVPASAQAGGTAADAAVHPVVAAYASDYSVTHAEAQRRLERIPELQRVTEGLRAAESARLAGWGIDHRGPFGAWVWLTGGEPAGAAAVAAAAEHDDVEIRFGAAVTFAALAAAQDRFGFGESVGAVAGTGAAGGSSVSLPDLVAHTGVDLRANALEIGIDRSRVRPQDVPGGLEASGPVGPTGNTGENDQNQVALSAIDRLLAPHISVPYKVTLAELPAPQAALEGGRLTSHPVTIDGERRTRSCTSGFGAYHGRSRTYGIITAGHCLGTTMTSQGVTLTRRVYQRNAGMDAAFYSLPRSGGHTATNRFVCTNNFATQDTCSVRSIGPLRLGMIDDYVCHSGNMSGISCGQIDNVKFRPHIPEGGCDGNNRACQPVFVRASGRLMKGCKGDSGGPVYSYSAAYGIYMGNRAKNGCSVLSTWVFFSPIRQVEYQLNVSVLTR